MPTAALSAAVYVVSARSAAGVRHKRRQRTHVLLGELPLERGHHPQSVSDRAQDALGIRLQFIQIRPHLAAGCRCLEGMAQGTGGLDGGKQRLATRQHLRSARPT